LGRLSRSANFASPQLGCESMNNCPLGKLRADGLSVYWFAGSLVSCYLLG
jgi:hypothetical protein